MVLKRLGLMWGDHFHRFLIKLKHTMKNCLGLKKFFLPDRPRGKIYGKGTKFSVQGAIFSRKWTKFQKNLCATCHFPMPILFFHVFSFCTFSNLFFFVLFQIFLCKASLASGDFSPREARLLHNICNTQILHKKFANTVIP